MLFPIISSIQVSYLFPILSRYHICFLLYPGIISVSYFIQVSYLFPTLSRYHICSLLYPGIISVSYFIQVSYLFPTLSRYHICFLLYPGIISVPYFIQVSYLFPTYVRWIAFQTHVHTLSSLFGRIIFFCPEKSWLSQYCGLCGPWDVLYMRSRKCLKRQINGAMLLAGFFGPWFVYPSLSALYLVLMTNYLIDL